MKRWRGALLFLTIGLFGLLMLDLTVKVGSIDWQSCRNGLPRVAERPLLEVYFQALRLTMAEGGTLPQFHLFKLAALLPGFLICRLSPHPRMVYWQIMMLILVFGFLLSGLLPIEAQHNCDRRGTRFFLLPPLVLMYTLPAALFAAFLDWLNARAARPRPDADSD